MEEIEKARSDSKTRETNDENSIRVVTKDNTSK